MDHWGGSSDYCEVGSSDMLFASADFSHPFYVTVIDEVKPNLPGDYYLDLTNYTPLNRRIVEMNVAGVVLRESTFDFDAEGLTTLIGRSGVGRHRVVDPATGQVLEEGPAGQDENAVHFPVAPATGAQQDSLIYFYEYEPPRMEGNPEIQVNGELKAVGVKHGVTGTRHYLYTIEHGDPERPEIVTRERRFRTPQTNLANVPPDEEEITEHIYTYGPANDDFDPPVVAKLTRKPPAPRVTPAGVSEFRAVEEWTYNDQGQEIRRGMGSEDASGARVEYFVTTQEYDDAGRLKRLVVDADDAARVAPDPAVSTPLELESLFCYAGEFGLQRVRMPAGREQWIRNVPTDLATNGMLVWVFKDVVPPAGAGTADCGQEPGGGLCQILSPIDVTLYSGGSMVWKKSVRPPEVGMEYPPPYIDQFHSQYAVLFTDPAYEITSSTPSYGPNGEVVGVTQAGDGEALSVQVEYHESGQIERQLGPDGTITRNEYDALGRLVTTYQGTVDDHPFWGYPECSPEPCTYDDNMTLVEKRYYGIGPTDQHQLTELRNYRERPVNQFHVYENNQWVGGEPNEDSIGWRTVHEYDWRRREVVVRKEDSTGAALNHMVTWYDHQDRVRFSAEYGPGLDLGAVDPRAQVAGAAEPAATAILQATTPPLSLSETIYNHRGLTEQVRRYDVAIVDGSAYTATTTYYDYADRAIQTQSPNGPVQVTVYDAKGRQAATRTLAASLGSGVLAGAFEVARSESTFDPNDRVTQRASYERRHDAFSVGDEFLTTGNSVVSYVHSWYDMAGRVTTTANYGTNDSAGTFATGVAPTYGPEPTGPLPNALVTRNAYDDEGRLVETLNPDGTATHTEYDAFGRVRLTIENALDTDPAARLVTAHDYDDDGRLWRIAAVLPAHAGGVTAFDQINWSAADGSLQITQLEYDGAPVVDENGAALTLHNGRVWKVYYPDPATGQPETTPSFTYTYLGDGLVASRTDARGNVLHYTYDELGRLTQVDVDDTAWFDVGLPPELHPPYRVGRMEFDYDARSNLIDARAFGDDENAAEVQIAASSFEFDARGNLLEEFQTRYHPLSPRVGIVGYARDFSSASEYNFDRLATTAYPTHFGEAVQRDVSLHYGDDGAGVGSLLGRVTRIHDSELGDVATYDYAGVARRISLALNNGVTQTYAGGAGYSGLDQYGRPIDLHYKTSSGATIHRYEYAYDAAGNRLHARVSQVKEGTVTQVNKRSALYEYDPLQRLVGYQRGALNTTNDALLTGSGNPIPRTIDWLLDNLGNFSGGAGAVPPASVIETGDFAGTGVSETRTSHHATDSSNRIEELRLDDGAGGEFVVPMVYDSAGNLVFIGAGALTPDMGYWLQYDGLNRLVQVHQSGTLTADDFLPNGNLDSAGIGWTDPIYEWTAVPHPDLCVIDPSAVPPAHNRPDFSNGGSGECSGPIGATAQPHAPGAVVSHYRFDALARVVVRVALFWPLNLAADAGCIVPQRTDYFLDGARRIVEAQHTPAPAESDWCDAACVASCTAAWTAAEWRERDYLYGPDGVDEHLLFAQGTNPGYMLLDAGGNDVAVIKAGAANLLLPGGLGEQYTFSPYGTLEAKFRTSNTSLAHNRVGHQGLFFDSWEVRPSPEVLHTGQIGAYHNRNRFYAPRLGRFLNRDPNESVQPLLAAMASNAQPLDVLLSAFDLAGQFGDGANLYAYLAANPINRRDPSGLQYDPFEDVDDAIAGIWAQRSTALEGAYGMAEALLQGFARMAMQSAVEGLIVSLVPGGTLMVGAYRAYTGLSAMYNEGPSWSAALEFAGGAASVGSDLARAMGAFSAHRGAIHAARAGSGIPRAYKAFNQSNFRHNLKVLTRTDAPSDLHAHHMLPREFEARFRALQVRNIHDPKYGAWWHGPDHLARAAEYNDLWRTFLRLDRTADEIENYARQLSTQFGLRINF